MASILIADSGSTKTDWSLVDPSDKSVVRVKTAGINPVHHNAEQIEERIADLKIQLPEKEINSIKFFGAGCTPLYSSKVKDGLTNIFGLNAQNIIVAGDIEGAGLALFGHKKGIIGILGTGSVTALFRDGRIEERLPSLGYVLGDEGSGSAIGKRLLNAVFKRQLSPRVTELFNATYHLGVEELYRNVYQSHGSATYLASFAKFVSENREMDEIKHLALQEFHLFFERNVLPYPDYKELPLGLVGSIAFGFLDLIRSTAEEYGVKIEKIIQRPIFELENYFMNK